MKVALSRREALAAGCCACIAAGAVPVPPKIDSEVSSLVESATGRRRAIRDGAIPFTRADVAAASLPVNSAEETIDAAAKSAALAQAARRLLRTRLGDADRETLEVLAWDLERDAGHAPFYWHEFPLGYSASQLSTLGFQFFAPPPPGAEDGFLAKVRQAPGYVDAIRLRLVGQLERRLVGPRAEGIRAFDQFHTEAAEVTATIQRNAKLVGDRPNSAALAREAEQIAAGPLAEALNRLNDALRDRYIPSLPEQSEIIRAGSADAYFRELCRLRISDDLGLESTFGEARESLSRIDRDLATMRRKLGGPADADAFNRSMIGDPRWYVRSPDQLKQRLDEAIAQVRPLVPAYFHAMPATPFGVSPLPQALETRLLNGYFQGPTPTNPRGTYFYNGSRLDISNWAWIKPLVSHELIPGHHLQAALLFEAADLPAYRKGVFVSGYAEGWGEYARQLMEEAGFYEGDLWGLYASRLVERRFVLRAVVETGIRRRGWTWQRAESELAQDPLTRPSTTQQLALSAATLRSTGAVYWWGLRRFLELRRLAQQRAGRRFDIRDFHSSVMRGDLVPFSVAERRVRAFPRES